MLIARILWPRSLAVLNVIRRWEVNLLAVLEYIFHGDCKRVSRILNLAYELVSKFMVHDLAKTIILQNCSSF